MGTRSPGVAMEPERREVQSGYGEQTNFQVVVGSLGELPCRSQRDTVPLT